MTNRHDEAALLERGAIRATLEEYFNALDARDFERLGACFTVDARADYEEGAAGRLHAGRGAIVARVRGIERCTASTHSLSSTMVELAGDAARADTFATAVLLLGPNAGGTVVVRGLRYQDGLVRTADGWLIEERVHRALWQYELPSQPCGVTAYGNASPAAPAGPP